jgi:hypothetical protein
MLRFNTNSVIKSQLASNNGRIKTIPVFEYPPEGVQKKKLFPKTEAILCDTLNLVSSVWYS